MPAPRLGFVGFGEAGSRIAAGLQAAGAGEMFAYDIEPRPPASGVEILNSNAALAERCHIIFSVVTAASAVDAARQNAPHLSARHTYIDCNSVSPAKKREIADVIQSTPARFFEAAIMSPVPKTKGQSAPMLINGEFAASVAEALAPLGFAMEPMCAAVGTAAAVKMCRSIVIKGMEALLTECVLAASRLGAEDRVFASLQHSYPGLDWKQLADYMVNRLTVHGERRAREMDEVAAMLREIGVEPMMSEAAARRHGWSAQLGLAARFGPEGPRTYREMIEAVGWASGPPTNP
jgi:3-hydroxyisobutyrate dehydrogenase-like beta-hydroxyacid dehydrogenase